MNSINEQKAATPPLIRLSHIRKCYGMRVIFEDLSLQIGRGEFWMIVGPSGAGKSTLLSLLGLLDWSFTGEYQLEGVSLSARTDRERCFIRNQKIGMIFQSFHLIPDLSVRENILLPLLYAPAQTKRMQLRQLESLLDTLDLRHTQDTPISLLSGGEQQRVAIARALLLDPALLLADEPTGSLDPANTARILSLLKQACARGKAVVMATHDETLLSKADHVFSLS